MPRSLSGRILLAFGGLALAALLAIGGTLFVALVRTDTTDEQDSLVSISVALARPAILNGTVNISRPVTASGLDREQVTVYVVRSGQLTLIDGQPIGISAPDFPTPAAPKTMRGSTHAGGTNYLWGATVFGAATRRTSGIDAVLIVAPDTAAARAIGTLAPAMLALLLVMLLVGIPAAWLLSRSVTRPIGRLAHATRGVTAGGGAAQLPAEGPSEVRELTAHFNQMSAELSATRHEEAQLLANLRHDLRTPLTSISGFAEAIADGTVTGEGAASAARTIVEESRRLERLVAELGVIERLRDGAASLRPERLEPAALLQATVERFQPQANAAGVTVGTPDASAVPAFDGDRLAIERILQNLVGNALKVTPRDGHVWLDAAPWQPPGGVPGVLFRVNDDGPGFPPGTLDRVFERFYRADPARSGNGSGLGLAIVRELARAHGGEAWAENLSPRGARVSVYVPCVPPAGVTQQ